MEASQIYILISIIALAIIGIAIFFVNKKKNKKQKNLTPLTGIAFAFVISGIVFGDNRLVGYSLMGIGIILAVIDIFLKKRK